MEKKKSCAFGKKENDDETRSVSAEPEMSFDPYMQSMSDREAEAICELRTVLKKTHPSLSEEDTFMCPEKYPGFTLLDVSDHTLLRFIRARNGDVRKAEKMIRRSMLFRKYFVTHKLVQNKLFHPIVDKFRPGGIPDWAVDRDGAPVFYDRGGMYDPRTRDIVQDNEDWIIYEIVNMEICIAKLHEKSSKTRKYRQVTVGRFSSPDNLFSSCAYYPSHR